MSHHVNNSIVFANNKGGVGKTSVSANVAFETAYAGRDVLLVDLDPQGNLGTDLGYRSTVDDEGMNLAKALQFGDALQPVSVGKEEALAEHGGSLDVIPGGRHLAALQFGDGAIPYTELGAKLQPLLAGYHLVVFDTPPTVGSGLTRSALVCAASLVLCTRQDNKSFAGFLRTTEMFEQATASNPDLTLVGALLFGISRSSTKQLRHAREEIGDDVLQAFVGDSPNASKYMSYHGLTARELNSATEAEQTTKKPWYERLGGKKDSDPTADSVSPTAIKRLFDDYVDVTREIHERIAASQAAKEVA